MAENSRKFWVVAYDISDAYRLAGIYRVIKAWGVRLQYSVYLVQCTISEINTLTDELRAVVDHTEDDIRIYSLPKDGAVQEFGQGTLPKGVNCIGKTGTQLPISTAV